MELQSIISSLESSKSASSKSEPIHSP